MKPILETLISRACDCEQLVKDIDLIRSETYAGDLPMEKIVHILEGTASLYDLRFAALSEAYGKAVEQEGFFHYPIEECVMHWWSASDDLRCAAEGAKEALLDTDGIDNVLLGVRSMSIVRGARFFALFETAKTVEDVPVQSEPKKAKKIKKRSA